MRDYGNFNSPKHGTDYADVKLDAGAGVNAHAGVDVDFHVNRNREIVSPRTI